MELQVKGMHCPSCETLVSEALEDAGATNISANAKSGKVICEGIDVKKAKAVIKEEGYEV